MGFPTGDNDVEFGDDCLAAFPAGLTPKTIGLRFVGILQGALWVPADGEPQNIELTLTQTAIVPCGFQIIVGGLVYSLSFRFGNTSVTIAGYPWGLGFSGSEAGTPKIFIENDRIVPAGNHFYGGHAELSILPGEDLPTIHGMQDLLNIEHDSETFVSVFGIDTDETVYRMGRRFDASNISIKTEE